jgi:hypothetical protein
MRPIQPSAFQYLLPQLVQSGANTQTSGASGWTPGGGFSLQIPDNTIIGGNPRGLGAVDLQTQRTAATQVASGVGSFVMGVNNRASGTQSVAMGVNSTASGDQSVAIGANCTANGTYSAATGASTASGANSTAMGSSTASSTGATAMGSGSTASGNYSLAVGASSTTNASQSVAMGASGASGSYATAMGASTATHAYSTAMGNSTASNSWATAVGNSLAGQIGKFTNSGGAFSTAGDSQTGMLVVRASTTTNTTVVLTSNGAAAATTNQLIVSTNQAIAFTGELIGKQSGSANTVAYEIKGRLVNNAGTVTMPTGTLTLIGTDDITLDTAPTLAADNTNKGLTVTSGAKTTTNIRWVCTLRSTEVVYA